MALVFYTAYVAITTTMELREPAMVIEVPFTAVILVMHTVFMWIAGNLALILQVRPMADRLMSI